MELTDLINALLPQLIPAAVTVFLAIGTFLGKKFVELYASKQQAALIETIIKQTVGYVEQVGKTLGSEEKKALAISKTVEYAQAKGINISEVEVDIMIEAFVNGIKTADAIVDDSAK